MNFYLFSHCRDNQDHCISYDPERYKNRHVIPKTPPGMTKSQRRKWREEKLKEREKEREDERRRKMLEEMRQSRLEVSELTRCRGAWLQVGFALVQ